MQTNMGYISFYVKLRDYGRWSWDLGEMLGTIVINSLVFKTGSDRCNPVFPSIAVDDVERRSNKYEAACVY